MKVAYLFLLAFMCSPVAHAQVDFQQSSGIEEEMQAIDESVDQPAATEQTPPDSGFQNDIVNEPATQDDLVDRPVVADDKLRATPTASEMKVDSTTGEKTILVPHPAASQGLDSVGVDRAYQYRVPLKEKKQSSTVTASILQPLSLSNTLPNGTTIKYSQIYNTNTLVGISANYEWLPLKSFRALAVELELGGYTSQGVGVLSNAITSQETYTLYILPFTANLKYRFEFRRRQLFVPFIEGGTMVFFMGEIRDDGHKTLAYSPAIDGGGGLMMNVSRFNKQGAFVMDREYGIADMWLTAGAKQIVGLKSTLDVSNTLVQLGFTIDY